MTSLGFLTIKKQQEVTYFTQIASCVKSNHIHLYRFTPLDIDPSTEMVHGLIYNKTNQEWEQAVFPIPTYIYDRCFYQEDDRSKKSEPIVRWLKQRPGSTFLGYGLPNKWEVYKELREHSIISSYLPKTELIENVKQLKKLLKKEKSIIIKPISGSQGNGVIHLQLTPNSIKVHTQKNGQLIFQSIESQTDFNRITDQLLAETAFIGQNYMELKHRARPFDIRVLLQKDEKGNWVEQGRGIRVGQENGLVSNLHNGGEVVSFSDVILNWSSPLRELIQEEIDTIIHVLPSYLEEKFGRLFELGLDIGVTKEGAVWVLDINSKPGRKVITSINPTIHDRLHLAPLTYIRYLDQAKTETI